jgi:3-(3-hydroxy-phenyl)propionate hydroxylase
MHQPATQARPSLYYSYQVHRPWLADQHPPQARQKVLIAGAGPAGMVAALKLAQLGVASVVLASELQVSEGSRAIVFTRRSMEILQDVGVAQRVSQSGLPWRFGNSYYRGQRVFRMEAPHDEDERFFPMINLQQQFMEEYLYDACRQEPLIDFRWGNKVEAVVQQATHATVTVDTPAGPYTLETEWLIAADGGRSGLRSAMKLQMEGASYEGHFVIADIRCNLPLPTERLAFFDPDWNPGNTVLVHREPHGMWRVDYQLPAGESPQDALQPEALKTRINATLAMLGHPGIEWALDWSSVYSARTLTLPNFVQGRVIFTGDAAHLLPIFGVRGANTAFQDAQSLGWHLAMVLRGLADRRLLDKHSRERVGAAREIIEEAGKSTRFMTPPTRGFKLLRDSVLSLSLTQDFVRPLYHWRTSRPHAYTDSALNAAGDDKRVWQTGPAQGAPPQNVRLGPDDHLLDHLGPGFNLLYATPDAVPSELLAELQAQQQRGLPLKLIAVGAACAVRGADHSLADEEGRLRQRYGMARAGAAYLLRPDHHVSARWQCLDAAGLRAALDAALSFSESHA